MALRTVRRYVERDTVATITALGAAPSVRPLSLPISKVAPNEAMLMLRAGADDRRPALLVQEQMQDRAVTASIPAGNMNTSIPMDDLQ